MAAFETFLLIFSLLGGPTTVWLPNRTTRKAKLPTVECASVRGKAKSSVRKGGTPRSYGRLFSFQNRAQTSTCRRAEDSVLASLVVVCKHWQVQDILRGNAMRF